jgi:hypothetical protein
MATSEPGHVGPGQPISCRVPQELLNGEVEIPTPAGDFDVHLTPPSSEHWRRWVSSLGALVCGRTLFEVAEGWQGRHTLDVPVVVVTHRVPSDWVEAHPEAPFTFVTDGVAAAVAQAQTLAGDRVVAVTVAPSPDSAANWGYSTRWPSISSRS